MPTAVIDGITTRYEVTGSGPALLLFSPGGFDSSLESWRTVPTYRDLGLLEALAEDFTCVAFDRRESGRSGGRVQRLSWAAYASQGLGLLDHLGIGRAHLMGGCVGCSTAAQLAVTAPERVGGMVLYSPAGGALYRMKQHERFRQHLAFAAEHGLSAVAELAASTTAGFSKDPRVGPWAAVLRSDPAFAARYAAFDAARYATAVSGSARLLFDRDTVPGPEPEDLLLLDTPTLIAPGEDTSHAPSAARHLQECLPHCDYWDLPVRSRTRHNTPQRIRDFLKSVPI